MQEAKAALSVCEGLRNRCGPYEDFLDLCQSMLGVAMTATGSIVSGICLDDRTGKKRPTIVVIDQEHTRHGFEERLREDLLKIAHHVFASQSVLMNDVALLCLCFINIESWVPWRFCGMMRSPMGRGKGRAWKRSQLI